MTTIETLPSETASVAILSKLSPVKYLVSLLLYQPKSERARLSKERPKILSQRHRCCPKNHFYRLSHFLRYTFPSDGTDNCAWWLSKGKATTTVDKDLPSAILTASDQSSALKTTQLQGPAARVRHTKSGHEKVQTISNVNITLYKRCKLRYRGEFSSQISGMTRVEEAPTLNFELGHPHLDWEEGSIFSFMGKRVYRHRQFTGPCKSPNLQ